ncbi:MAG: hypothetical protein A3C35_02130 [Omnitrophica bacterium RIFCSPHIGHO2_02_FULL_46_11]|nr:MAG: hypothetical protein A3C35_02130 [Omnitrophica bacterium RIFCSPHIGHO2_02_FULL_46_11]
MFFILTLLFFQNSAYATTNVGADTNATNGDDYNFTADATLTIGNGVSLGSTSGISVNTAVDNNGTVTITNSTGTTTIPGTIGIDAGDIDVKNVIINTTQSVLFQSDVFVFPNFNFSADGTAILASGVGIADSGGSGTTDVLTSTASQGTLTLQGSNVMDRDVGGAGARLKQINVTGSGSSAGRNVFTNGMDLDGNVFSAAAYNQSPASSGTLAIDISSATSYGNIALTGNATVGANTTVNANVQGYVRSGSTLTIVNGNAGVGVVANLPVTDNSAVLTFTPNSAAGADLTLTVSSNYNTSGGSNNPAADVLKNIDSGGASGDMANVLAALQMASAGDVDKAVNSMDPDVSRGTVDGSSEMLNQFLDTVGARLGYARSGVVGSSGIATGDMFHGIGFWIQGFGNHSDQGTRHGVEGYQANVFGTAIGADKLLSPKFRLGLAGGYAYGDVNSKSVGRPETDVNSFQGVIYGSYDIKGARLEEKNPAASVPSEKNDSLYVDGLFAFSHNNYDSSREVFLGSSTRTANSDYNGQQYSTKWELGYTLPNSFWQDIRVTPFTSLQYSYLHLHSYTEKNAGALNLHVEGSGYNTMEQGLGAKVARPIVSKKLGTFIPSLKATWLLDYWAEKHETTASFTGGGSSFTTSGAKPSRNGLISGAEIIFLTHGRSTLTANYDWELRDEFSGHSYYLTGRVDF